MRPSLRLEGADAFDDRLVGLLTLTDPSLLADVGETALTPIADAARTLVRRRTGRLARSLAASTHLSPAQAASTSPAPGTVEIYVGPGSMPQAITEEFGTVDELPHPYLRPAWDEREGDVLPAVAALLASKFLKG